MSCNIIVSSVFERSAKRLAKHYCSFRDDFSGFLTALKDNPFMGVDLGRGLRKVRMAVTSKDKELRGLLKRCGLEAK